MRRHVGVYQLGPFAGPFGPEQAALLACGPRAVLGHWTSIGVFELRPRGNRPVEVLLPGGLAGQRPGIRPHRATALPACDVVLRHGLRVTTPARTLLDLAASTPRAVLERLTEEAQVQKLASGAELLAVIERGARRPGVRKLRAIVDLLDEPLLTRSEAERRLIALCRSAALSAPPDERAPGALGGRCGLGRAAARGGGRRLQVPRHAPELRARPAQGRRI